MSPTMLLRIQSRAGQKHRHVRRARDIFLLVCVLQGGGGERPATLC